MKTVGITGGVGAGKSQVLSYINENYNVFILLADDVANALKEPGKSCYESIVKLLGKGILGEDKRIDNRKMAAALFQGSVEDGQRLLLQVNEIIHPRVREEILATIEEKRKENQIDVFFLEAALLIEEHYDEVLDELWLIDTAGEVRRERLKAGRGYSDEKITAIMQKQLSEEAFRGACQVVIDNSNDFTLTKQQIDKQMEEIGCRSRI